MFSMHRLMIWVHVTSNRNESLQANIDNIPRRGCVSFLFHWCCYCFTRTYFLSVMQLVTFNFIIFLGLHSSNCDFGVKIWLLCKDGIGFFAGNLCEKSPKRRLLNRQFSNRRKIFFKVPKIEISLLLH